jgi:hypothetical protein
MEKEEIKKGIYRSFLILIVFAIIFHSYYFIYGASLPNVNTNISGNSISEDLLNNISSLNNKEKLIIILEWSIILSILFIIIIKKAHAKLAMSKELSNVKKITHSSELKSSRSKTDIDLLYDLLIEKKRLKLQLIIKRFGVNKDIVMHWYEILEEGNLANIEYPTIGDPELVLKEEIKKEEIKNEKKDEIKNEKKNKVKNEKQKKKKKK